MPIISPFEKSGFSVGCTIFQFGEKIISVKHFGSENTV